MNIFDEQRAPDASSLLAGRSVGRPRLLAAVQERWERPLTAVVAGAGFGKTTLLAQAITENRLARRGVDLALRLEAPDASAARLAARLLAEFGVEPFRVADPDHLVERIHDTLWTQAPTQICIVLDDVHELPTGSDGVTLVRSLIERLPRNAHVLLGSRTLPEVGVARLAVAGDALVLREEDLRFTADELAEFATLRAVDPERLAPADGWPALAELLARTTGVTTAEYVWEQVIAPLDADTRNRLEEVAALRGADDALASVIAGHEVRLADTLAGLPLVQRRGDGWWELHDVIAAPVLARVAPDRVAELRCRGGVLARDAGNVDRALRLFAAAGASDEIVATVRATYIGIGAPEDPALAKVWSALLPSELDGEPEIRLLRTIATAIDDPERGYALGRETVAAFAARGDVDGEIAALARLGAIAYALADAALMAQYVPRVAELAATGHPGAVAFDAVCRGAFAYAIGEWQRAEEILTPVAADPDVDPSQGIAAYFCARAQLEAGRFLDAARTVDRMPEEDRRRVHDGVLGMRVAIAQAMGATDEVLEGLRAAGEAELDRRPLVARRVSRCRMAVGRATVGDGDGARRELLELELLGRAGEATLDEELMADAAIAVLDGDEEEATARLRDVPDRGVFFPPLEGSTLMYVLRPELRERYDAMDLRGVHAQRRAYAAAFAAARDGDLAPLGRYEWPRPLVVRWFGPAPWLVEAAVCSSAAGNQPPRDLLDTVAPIVRPVLERLAASAHHGVARAATTYLEDLPPVAPCQLVVRGLGSVRVERDGVRSTAPELRRERVRSLLGLLVLRRSIRRIEAAGALWPDLSDDQALGNLRVTLSYLLRLLEPDRPPKAPSFFVVQDADRLALREDAAVWIDVWDFETAVAEADELERSGAPSLALDALVRAVGHWRGELLADVTAQEWLHFDRVRLGTMFVRSALRAGELLAAHHELTEAAEMAERVIRADPWNEAAFRLLASVHLERGDRSAARHLLDHLDEVLADLGVAPDRETLTLRERCAEPG